MTHLVQFLFFFNLNERKKHRDEQLKKEKRGNLKKLVFLFYSYGNVSLELKDIKEE